MNYKKHFFSWFQDRRLQRLEEKNINIKLICERGQHFDILSVLFGLIKVSETKL
jgi:hypothetical protein